MSAWPARQIIQLASYFRADSLPHELFQLPAANASRFVVSRDAQRFLFAVPPQNGERPSLTAVVNWTAAIKK